MAEGLEHGTPESRPCFFTANRLYRYLFGRSVKASILFTSSKAYHYTSTASRPQNASAGARTGALTHAQTDRQPENIMPPTLFIGWTDARKYVRFKCINMSLQWPDEPTTFSRLIYPITRPYSTLTSRNHRPTFCWTTILLLILNSRQASCNSQDFQRRDSPGP